jgi:hypothetical protein
MCHSYVGVTRIPQGDIVVACAHDDAGEIVEEVGSSPSEVVERVETLTAGRTTHLCVDGRAAGALDLALAFARLPSAEVFVLAVPVAAPSRGSASDFARHARRAL